jgi:hypothetical protein
MNLIINIVCIAMALSIELDSFTSSILTTVLTAFLSILLDAQDSFPTFLSDVCRVDRRFDRGGRGK